MGRKTLTGPSSNVRDVYTTPLIPHPTHPAPAFPYALARGRLCPCSHNRGRAYKGCPPSTSSTF